MRAAAAPALRAGLVTVLLVIPTALAFFAGGYFDEPRLWAGLVAWTLVLVALVLDPHAIPRRRASWFALGGLALLALWSLGSIAWAPVADTALASGQRLVLYTGLLAAAVLLLGRQPAVRAVEPTLGAGALLAVGYGVAGRLLPGLLHFHHSLSAQGRLEQPLTYWNAMGEEAALGLVLAVRLAADRSRPEILRGIAVAAVAPLGMGLYLTFSRGALFAAGAGLLALVFAAPYREMLRTLLLAVAAAILASLAAAPFGGVTSLAGGSASRERQGVIVLGLLVVIAAGAVFAHRRLVGRGAERDCVLRLPRRAWLVASGLICAGLAIAIVAGAHENAGRQLSNGVSRLGTLQSDRYQYWRVALRAFSRDPLHGVGAGNWSTYWLRWRPFGVGAQDAHSLPIQTLAEVGLVGLALLLTAISGVAFAAVRAHRTHPVCAAGPLAVLVTYLAHAPLDWDWQLPAVTGLALVAAGAILAQSETSEPIHSRSRHAMNSTRLGARLAGGAVAVLAAGWLALSLWQVELENGVATLLESHLHLSAAQARNARGDLDRAAFLNPQWSLRSTRATVAGHAGDQAQALALARAGVRYEPENVDTWLLLGLLVQHDPAAYANVEAHIRRLVPPVPPPR